MFHPISDAPTQANKQDGQAYKQSEKHGSHNQGIKIVRACFMEDPTIDPTRDTSQNQWDKQCNQGRRKDD